MVYGSIKYHTIIDVKLREPLKTEVFRGSLIIKMMKNIHYNFSFLL